MECVEGALKSSFRKEMAIRMSPQRLSDDIFHGNTQNVIFPEEFSVDDLLDFSNDDGIVIEEADEDEEQEQQEQHHVSNQSSNFSSGEDLMCVADSPLVVVPVDDLEELEWLSHFVEDSFSESYVARALPEKPNWSLSGKEALTVGPLAVDRPCFRNTVPAKFRTKRRSSQSRDRYRRSTSSETSESSYYSSNVVPVELATLEQTLKPPVKRQKRGKPKSKAVYGGSWAHQPRRCSHCGVQKTPQWRTGPLGAKTLCNACGVRFKSGRLLPEYRPACSPTFSSELHSNSHRKVLEMRRKKEMSLGRVEPSLILPSCA